MNYNTGENNSNFKHGKCCLLYYCINCGEEISYNSLRCNKCNGIFKRKLKSKCPICKKELSRKDAKYCKKHSRLLFEGENNPSYIDGKTLKENYCKCGKKISIYAIYCELCNYKLHSNRMKGKNNPMFGRIAKHGKGSYYKKIWMRSSWETIFAKWLDKQGIKWFYEFKTFDLGDCTYTPDFYLPENDIYIEVKGFWRDDAKKKFKLFKQKYNKEKIKIIDKQELQSIGAI